MLLLLLLLQLHGSRALASSSGDAGCAGLTPSMRCKRAWCQRKCMHGLGLRGRICFRCQWRGILPAWGQSWVSIASSALRPLLLLLLLLLLCHRQARLGTCLDLVGWLLLC